MGPRQETCSQLTPVGDRGHLQTSQGFSGETGGTPAEVWRHKRSGGGLGRAPPAELGQLLEERDRQTAKVSSLRGAGGRSLRFLPSLPTPSPPPSSRHLALGEGRMRILDKYMA